MSTLKKLMVQCDEKECGWSEIVDRRNIQAWHKKECPECGRGEILTDVDMEYFYLVIALTDAQDKIDPDGKLPSIGMGINTSGLRE